VGGLQPHQSQTDIKALQAAVAPVTAQGGQVLFISERQLLTFDSIRAVPLVPDDELVALMEIAMSHNTPALSAFYSDLHQHRFALIVSRKLNTGVKTGEAFSEENNAWNQYIAAPILCEYQPFLGCKAIIFRFMLPALLVRNPVHKCHFVFVGAQ
jgi:hypothetical protein